MKPGGQEAAFLTFPLIFQREYRMKDNYYPEVIEPSLDLMIGSDFQSDFHEEKRRDAHQSVRDGIQANATKERLMMTGFNNYHVPKPVLGQRVFANPSQGAESFYSARQDNEAYNAPFQNTEDGMRGGVVTSIEGQNFYKKQLANRISQLNRINALAQGYAVQLGQNYRTEDNTKEGSFDKVQFFILVRALMDSVIEGDLTRFTFENLKEMLNMMFQFGPTMSEEDINDVRDSLDQITIMVQNGLSANPDITNIPEKQAYAETLDVYIKKMIEFFGILQTSINYSTKDKTTLVKSLKKSLQFDKLLVKNAEPMTVLNSIRQTNPRVNQVYDDIDEEETRPEARFGTSATAREDTEQLGIRRQPFAGKDDDENRVKFGKKTGLIVFGGPSYFGEDYTEAKNEDLRPQYVAPLGLSGADPNANVIPQANPQILVEAAEKEIVNVLTPLGFQPADDIAEFVTANYPSPNDFVNEVAAALQEKGYSKAQIADGFTRLELDIFGDYIAENAGDTEPEPARRGQRAVDVLPFGGLAPPIYRDNDVDGAADVVPPADVGEANEEDNFTRYNLPKTRIEFLDEFNTVERLRDLGLRIPARFGGPYRPRAGTTIRNMKAYIVRLLKRIDPDF
jgi:hypothetical protein